MLSWKDSKNASDLTVQYVSLCDVWNRNIIEKKVLPDYTLYVMDERRDFDETLVTLLKLILLYNHFTDIYLMFSYFCSVPYKPSDNRDLSLVASLQLYQTLSLQNQNLANDVGLVLFNLSYFEIHL